jgi:DNA-binding transcriptional MerR regulator
MISDAARMVSLEQHVLRYWEDELQLEIPRNEMGHRYYTDENINEILRIKELREQGYQLKAIRMYLKKEKQRAGRQKRSENFQGKTELDGFITFTSAEELGIATDGEAVAPVETPVEDETQLSSSASQNPSPETSGRIKMEQFQALMTEIVGQALRENNAIITEHVEERILKEMNYLMQEHYQMEEDRYRKLDEAIRGGFRKRKEDRKKLFRKK